MSLHRYLYANASPVSLRDPTGRFTMLSVMATVGISNILAAAPVVGMHANSADSTALGKFIGAIGNYLEGAGNIRDFKFKKSGISFLLTLYAGPTTLYSVETSLPIFGAADLIFGIAGGDAVYRILVAGGSVNAFSVTNPIRFAIWKGFIPFITDAKIDRISIGGNGVFLTYSNASGGAALLGLSSGTVSLSKKTIVK